MKDVKATDTLVTEFTVHYRSAAKAMTVPAVRRRTTIAVGERLTGMWKAQFAREGDTVTFNRRPPLPTYVPRPTTPAPQPGDEAYSLIPQGVDEVGRVVHWDISGACAHFSGRKDPLEQDQQGTQVAPLRSDPSSASPCPLDKRSLHISVETWVRYRASPNRAPVGLRRVFADSRVPVACGGGDRSDSKLFASHIARRRGTVELAFTRGVNVAARPGRQARAGAV